MKILEKDQKKKTDQKRNAKYVFFLFWKNNQLFRINTIYKSNVLHEFQLIVTAKLSHYCFFSLSFHLTNNLERFSFECRKVIGFAFTTLRDWLKRFAPLFYPIRRKTKTNCVTLACIFPRFASATCNYFEF